MEETKSSLLHQWEALFLDFLLHKWETGDSGFLGLTWQSRQKDNSTRCSQAVSHPSTNRAQRCLTSVIGRELVFSTWYGRCRERRRNSKKTFYVDYGIPLNMESLGGVCKHIAETKKRIWASCTEHKRKSVHFRTVSCFKFRIDR